MSVAKPTTFSFEKSVLKTIHFLEKTKTEYLILGGLAVGVLGEPRFTRDLDIDIFVDKAHLVDFLKKAKQASFRVDLKESLSLVEQFGTCRMFYAGLQIDLILASTELEKTALQRQQRISLFGKKMSFPSPEDILLFKLIPGRPKDLIDAESIILRHGEKLDIVYMRQWIQKLCDEAEDFRLLRLFEKLLQSSKESVSK